MKKDSYFDYFKVLQGHICSNRVYKTYTASEVNENVSKAIELKDIFVNTGNDLCPVNDVYQGDVFALKRKSDEYCSLQCGDYLLPQDLRKDTKSRLKNFPRIDIPHPIVYYYIEPEKQAKRSQVLKGIQEIIRLDPSLSLSIDDNQGAIIVGGQGKIHMDVLISKLKEFHGVDASLKKYADRNKRYVYRESPKINQMSLDINRKLPGLEISIVPTKESNNNEKVVSNF